MQQLHGRQQATIKEPVRDSQQPYKRLLETANSNIGVSERHPATIGDSERHAATTWDQRDSDKHPATILETVRDML